MIITINNHIYLEQIAPKHAQGIFDIADSNRPYLRKWLPWVDNMHDVDFFHAFINGAIQRHNQGNEWSFVIVKNERIIGRVGVYKIDNQHKIGEIGYWIAENEQGKGIVKQACKAMIDYAFNDLKLNRIEIKCGTGNVESQRIPEKLGFVEEGIIRQGERLRDGFIDLKLYSLLKENT
jgi:ribosomal-protein-serine acetyltransferase